MNTAMKRDTRCSAGTPALSFCVPFVSLCGSNGTQNGRAALLHCRCSSHPPSSPLFVRPSFIAAVQSAAPLTAEVEVEPYAPPMPSYFLVENAKGPAFDHSRGRREQEGWDAHAAFMDRLTDEGFIVLGGPIGDGEGENTLLVIAAEDEAAVRARLAEDPWSETVLTIYTIRSWSVWLGEPRTSDQLARPRVADKPSNRAPVNDWVPSLRPGEAMVSGRD